MKKTLAILLALLMTSSIALVSCEGNSRTPNSGDWDDENDYVDESDDGTSDTSNESGDSTDSGDEGNGDTSVTGWIEKSGSVWAGMKLNLRTQPSTGSTVSKVVDPGTKLNLVSSNGVWDKVTLDGSATEYYALHCLISDTNESFNFEECNTELTFTGKGNVCLYVSPFHCSDNNYTYNNIYKSAGVKSLAEGAKITKVGLSANGWMKVTVTGTVNFDGGTSETFATATEFYINPNDVNTGRITDPDRPASGTPGGGNG